MKKTPLDTAVKVTMNKPFTSDYKGTPVLNIPTGNSFRPTFAFGPNKARMILKYVKEIEKFVNDNPTTTEDE